MNDKHTIKSGIVKDTLYCLTNNFLPNSYIGGGMSLQFTLPDAFYRKTADIDFTSSDYLNRTEFKNFLYDSLETMLERGYELSFNKTQNTYDGKLVRDEDILIIQLPRKSKKAFDKKKNILEREVSNAREIEYGTGNLKLIKYEDLMAHKTLRSLIFTDNYNIRIPKENELLSLLNSINKKKKELESGLYMGSPQKIARQIAYIRLTADVFDIKTMLMHFDIDEKYFHESLRMLANPKKTYSNLTKTFDEINS